MTDDWPQIKARLGEMDEDHFDPNAIDAALQRESEQAQALEDTLADYEKAMQEVGALRQRVEELERELELRKENLNYEFKRAEAAEGLLKSIQIELEEERIGRRIEREYREAAEARLAKVVEALQRFRAASGIDQLVRQYGYSYVSEDAWQEVVAAAKGEK